MFEIQPQEFSNDLISKFSWIQIIVAVINPTYRMVLASDINYYCWIDGEIVSSGVSSLLHTELPLSGRLALFDVYVNV